MASNITLAEKVGPDLWNTIHWIAITADELGYKDPYIDLLVSLTAIHPCASCRENLMNHLQELSPDLYNSMFDHSFHLHNMVNEMLGKNIMEKKDAIILYSNVICSPEDKTMEKICNSMWKSLHWLAITADEIGYLDPYLDTLVAYSIAFPCETYRETLLRHLDKLSPDTFDSMFDHSYKLHNSINRYLNKPIFPYMEAKQLYTDDCQSCSFSGI